MDRRNFIKKSASLPAAGLLAPQLLRYLFTHKPNGLAIGFQSWVVREPLNEDFPGTLAKMAGMGYETIEMCSPAGYARAGFEPLTKFTGQEIKHMIENAGLSISSSHFTFAELNENPQASIDFAKDAGLSYMVISSFGIKPEAGLDEWKKATDKANKLGEMAAANDLQLGFHNHNLEFEERDGRLIYDVLLERLDPELVKLQFQVWVVSIGFHAADYFRNHPGRYISAHLSDWSGKETERTPIGSGKVDWPDFFEAGKASGLKEIYVEMAPELLKESADYLHSLR